MNSDSWFRARFQNQTIFCLPLDGSLSVQHWKITHLVPIRNEIGIMLASRLATLSGHIGHHGFIPVSNVQNFAIAGTADLIEGGMRIACVVHRVAVAWSRKGADVE